MSWARILAPLIGDGRDDATLLAAGSLAAPFRASLTGVFAAPSPLSLLGWMGEGSLNGLEAAAKTVERNASTGERDARARLAAFDYGRKSYEVSNSNDWAGLRMSARLSDVVVFQPEAARGEGLLAAAFQQVLMDERRPVLIADGPVDLDAPVAVAWDGGPEASRAARRAIPWLRKAREVVVLTAPAATPRTFEPGQLIGYLADQSVRARLLELANPGDAVPLLLQGVERIGAGMLVAGAFGHPRFQRFIFGGATRALLDARSGAALFISH
jgi:nucleotide-binding universal stress UspA family protein